MKRIIGVRIYATLLALTLSLTATAGATGATPANEAITSNTATTAMVPNADTPTKKVSTQQNPFFVPITNTVTDTTDTMKTDKSNTPEKKLKRTSALSDSEKALRKKQWQNVPGYSREGFISVKLAQHLISGLIRQTITYENGHFQYNDGQHQQSLTPQQAAYAYLIVQPFAFQIHRGDAYVHVGEVMWPTFWAYDKDIQSNGDTYEGYMEGRRGVFKDFSTRTPLEAADMALYNHGITPYMGKDYASLSDEGIVAAIAAETTGKMTNPRGGKLIIPGLVGATWDAGSYLGRSYKYAYTLNGLLPGAEPVIITYGLMGLKEDDTAQAVSEWALAGRTLAGDSLAQAEKFRADGYVWYLPKDATAVKTIDEPLHVRIESKNFIYDWEKITVPGVSDRWKSFKNIAGITLADFVKESKDGKAIGLTFLEDGVLGFSWSGQTKTGLPLIVFIVPNNTGYYRVRLEGLTKDTTTIIDTILGLPSTMSFVPPKEAYKKPIRSIDFFTDGEVDRLLIPFLQKLKGE